MSRLSLLPGFAALILILWPVEPTAAQSIQLSGSVRDAASQTPVEGANVLLIGTDVRRGATTDAEGAFRIGQVPPGSYRMEVTAVGFIPHTEPVELERTEREIAVLLEPTTYDLEEVVVSASRSVEELSSLPVSVSVVRPEELESRRTVTSDLGAILASDVPGIGVSTGTLSNYGQTLRGRDLFVLIDGVPQSTPLRNVLRDLRTVDPGAVERIEVVRGASATYGYGATGGLINIITRGPKGSGQDFHTELGFRSQPSDLADSFSGRIMQRIGGRTGRVGYLISGSLESRGNYFDGEGDRIPQDPHSQGGVANSDEYNLLGRIDIDLAHNQELQLSGNLYSIYQDVTFLTEPGVPGVRKATAVEAEEVPGKDPGTRNIVASALYRNHRLLGSSLSARLYYQNYASRFGFATYFPGGGGQSFLASEKFGGRVDLETPVHALPGSQLTWGLDFLRDETSQPLEDGREWVPPIRQTSAAPFLQSKLLVADRLVLRAGARYEFIHLNVDDFTTLFEETPVAGGTLDYDALLLNVGAVVFATDHLEAFASYSQGFSVTDVGRELRSMRTSSVEDLSPEAQKVNSYEVGLRYGSGPVAASLTGFLNTSELGATFGDLPELRIIRAPERIWGVEASADAFPTPSLALGGTFAVQEGKTDPDDDGDFDAYLPGDRIAPMKVTGYVSYSPFSRWSNRLQLLYSGSRDRFDGAEAEEYAKGPVESYVTVDLSSSFDLGAGAIRLGIENLFDTFFFPPISQWYNLGTGYAAAPGRTVSVAYVIDW